MNVVQRRASPKHETQFTHELSKSFTYVKKNLLKKGILVQIQEHTVLYPGREGVNGRVKALLWR